MCLCYLQVVLSKSVSDVAKKAVMNVRLPLLMPEEIEKLEKDNRKDSLVPVSVHPAENIMHFK